MHSCQPHLGPCSKAFYVYIFSNVYMMDMRGDQHASHFESKNYNQIMSCDMTPYLRLDKTWNKLLLDNSSYPVNAYVNISYKCFPWFGW